MLPSRSRSATVLVIAAVLTLTGCSAPSPADVDLNHEVEAPTASGPMREFTLEEIEAARGDLPEIYSAEQCYLPYAGTEVATCSYGDPASDMDVYLLGDSHAAQFAPAIISLAQTHGWDLRVHAKAACTYSANDHSDNRGNAYPECAAWVASIDELIKSERPELIITTGYARHPVYLDGVLLEGAANEAELGLGISRIWEPILEKGESQIVYIRDTPYIGFNSSNCLTREFENQSACVTPYEEAVTAEPSPETHLEESFPEVAVIDVNREICTVDEGDCGAGNTEQIIWRDLHHLRASFAETLAAPIESQLESLGVI